MTDNKTDRELRNQSVVLGDLKRILERTIDRFFDMEPELYEEIFLNPTKEEAETREGYFATQDTFYQMTFSALTLTDRFNALNKCVEAHAQYCEWLRNICKEREQDIETDVDVSLARAFAAVIREHAFEMDGCSIPGAVFGQEFPPILEQYNVEHLPHIVRRSFILQQNRNSRPPFSYL